MVFTKDLYCSRVKTWVLKGKGLVTSLPQNPDFLRPPPPHETSLLKTLWEKEKMLFFFKREKMLVTNIFFFSHYFPPIKDRNHHFSNNKFVVCKINALNLVKVKILSFGKHLTHYHTVPHFNTLKTYSCGKLCEKRRNCLLWFTYMRSCDVNKCAPCIEGITPHNFIYIQSRLFASSRVLNLGMFL